jgi:hypothetical protein
MIAFIGRCHRRVLRNEFISPAAPQPPLIDKCNAWPSRTPWLNYGLLPRGTRFDFSRQPPRATQRRCLAGEKAIRASPSCRAPQAQAIAPAQLRSILPQNTRAQQHAKFIPIYPLFGDLSVLHSKNHDGVPCNRFSAYVVRSNPGPHVSGSCPSVR